MLTQSIIAKFKLIDNEGNFHVLSLCSQFMFSVQARSACSKSGTSVRWTEVLDFDLFDFDPKIDSPSSQFRGLWRLTFIRREYLYELKSILSLSFKRTLEINNVEIYQSNWNTRVCAKALEFAIFSPWTVDKCFTLFF